jgi:hypothetical protein
MGEKRNAFKALIGKAGEKRLLETSNFRLNCNNHINVCLEEILRGSLHKSIISF